MILIPGSLDQSTDNCCLGAGDAVGCKPWRPVVMWQLPKQLPSKDSVLPISLALKSVCGSGVVPCIALIPSRNPICPLGSCPLWQRMPDASHPRPASSSRMALQMPQFLSRAGASAVYPGSHRLSPRRKYSCVFTMAINNQIAFEDCKRGQGGRREQTKDGR